MNSLIILLGPTGVGEIELGPQVAEHFGPPIISSDSRQLYKDFPIDTAAPAPEQVAHVKHYMIDTLSLTDYYSASNFEEDVVSPLPELYKTIPAVVMTGGSMIYIDAVCKGIDDIPTVTSKIRDTLYTQFETERLTPIPAELEEAGPIHYEEVDRSNYKRVVHAIEIYRMTDKPCSSLRTNIKKERPFRIIKVGLNRNRSELRDHINQHIDLMVNGRLLGEARRAYPFRHLNSLNTIGYKELFDYFSGEWTSDPAVEKIKRNSQVYVRKQMTWLRRDPEITWFHPDETEVMFTHLSQQTI